MWVSKQAPLTPGTPTVALIAADAKIPVAIEPQIPPTPWHANTSNESSIRDLPDLQLATKFEITPAAKPIINADETLTYPAAGVIATNPTTAPIAMPVADGFPLITQSESIQLTAAAAAAKFVVTSAETAKSFAANALPALNPNHPNQSNAAPKSTYGMLVGLNSVAWSFLSKAFM